MLVFLLLFLLEVWYFWQYELLRDPVEAEDILENIIIMTKLLADKDEELELLAEHSNPSEGKGKGKEKG